MLPDHSLRERESSCTRKLRTHFRTESEILQLTTTEGACKNFIAFSIEVCSEESKG